MRLGPIAKCAGIDGAGRVDVRKIGVELEAIFIFDISGSIQSASRCIDAVSGHICIDKIYHPAVDTTCMKPPVDSLNRVIDREIYARRSATVNVHRLANLTAKAIRLRPRADTIIVQQQIQARADHPGL